MPTNSPIEKSVEGLLTKKELAAKLNRPSTRIVDEWLRKRMISAFRLGHRTLLFDLDQVRRDLARFEIKAVGRCKQ